MKVLYLHPAATFGGASKSLIELYTVLRNMGVQGVVLTPTGTACRAFAEAGLEIRPVNGLSQFDNTRYGYYRKLRWIILLRELYLIPFTLFGLWRLRREQFDLIHVNEITLLPLGVLAKFLFGLPLVVHVRSLQRKSDGGLRTRWINALLQRYADAVVAIDHTVAATLGAGLPLHIIHNGMKIDNQVPCIQPRVDGNPVKIGFLGVLIPLKGVFELVEAIHLLKARGERVECLIAGENARKYSGIKAWLLGKIGVMSDVRAELEARIKLYGLERQVKLLGFVPDVRELYPRLDILCFPSHLNAAGRPVFEAAFYAVPSVVAVRDPLPDAILHKITGLAVPEPDATLIADALQRLAQDSAFRRQLGQQARIWAQETFDIKMNAARMLDLYRHVITLRSNH